MHYIKQVEPITVMYTHSFGDPAESDAFTRLEQVVQLKGRKFYGVYYPTTQEYRACVKMIEGDNPEALGLKTDAIAGGTYACRKLEGEYTTIIAQIKPTFDELLKEVSYDTTKPSVEFYKQHTEIILMLPILK